MRNALFIFIFLLFGCDPHLPPPKYDELKTDLEKNFINGKVESIELSNANFTNGSETETPYLQSISNYDTSGYRTELIKYDNFGKKVISDLLNEYKAGKLLKQTSKSFLENITFRTEFHYDSYGHYSRAEYYYNDTLQNIEVFKIDSSGNLIETLMMDSKNKVSDKFSYKYEFYKKDKFKTKYIIDSSQTKTDTSVYKHSYDSLDRLIESTEISKGMNTKSENKYDKNGFIEKINFYKNGELYKETTYDIHYNILQTNTYKNSSVKNFYYCDYKFDTHGNWTERTAKAEQNLYKEFRKIKYEK